MCRAGALLSAALLLPRGGSATPVCKPSKLDVILLLDASNSVSDDHWGKMMDFVTAMTNTMTIGPDSVRVGAVMYATLVSGGFPNQLTYNGEKDGPGQGTQTFADSPETVAAGIAQLRGGRTYGATGTPFAQWVLLGDMEEYGRFPSMIQLSQNQRPDAHVAVVWISDGKTSSYLAGGTATTQAQCQEIMARGAEIFVIGVGGYDTVELSACASSPKPDHLWLSEDGSWDIITQETIIDEVVDNVCKSPPGTDGDPFTEYNGKKTQFWAAPDVPFRAIECGEWSVRAEVFTPFGGDRDDQWFRSIALLRAGRRVATAQIRSHVAPNRTLDVWADKAAGPSVTVTASREQAGYEVATFVTGAMRIQVHSMPALKMKSEAEQKKYAHVDLRFPWFSNVSQCTGHLPEIWGVQPLTQETAKMLVPP